MDECLAAQGYATVADVPDHDELEMLRAEAMRTSCEEYLACLFVRVADQTRYGGLKARLDNEYLTQKKSAYPKTMAGALKILQNFKAETNAGGKAAAAEAEAGVAFAQTKLAQADKADVDCFGCGGKGHYGYECKKLTPKQIEELYAKRKAERQQQAGVAHVNTAAGSGAASVAGSTAGSVPSVVAAAPAGAPTSEPAQQGVAAIGVAGGNANPNRLSLEQFNRLMDFMDGVGMCQVGTAVGQGVNMLEPAQQESAQESGTGRLTLDSWKLYLDSCATYHSAFVKWILTNVHEVNMVLKGNCNASVTSSNTNGYYP